jgi:chromosome partitioning protein
MENSFGSHWGFTETEPMKVVTFSIFKGGTAKTTSTVNTAAALVKKGKKVLVIDLDQQASATRYLDPEASPNLYEVFTGNQQAALAIRKTKLGIDVLASHVLLAAIEEALEPGDETKLSGLIMPLRGSYDLFSLIPRQAKLCWPSMA